MDACEPAGYNFRPTRQFNCLYAFVRKLESDQYPSYEWDEDGVLRKIIFLSRLIHPTTISGQYSARMIFENSELQTVIPGHTQGFGTQVWIVAEEWRDWIDTTQAEALRDFWPRYAAETAPERVRRARARLGHALHNYYLDQRMISLVSSFESLLKVSQYKSEKQFCLRVSKLAELLGNPITEADALLTYKDRSEIVHGQGPTWNDVDAELMARYQQFELILRQALLKASVEPEFANNFVDDTVIQNVFGRI